MTNIILKPHISEKSTDLKNINQYIFRLPKNINKTEAKKLIEKRYGVKVIKINVLNMPAKSKRFRNIVSRRGAYKKVIITLKEGQKINLI